MPVVFHFVEDLLVTQTLEYDRIDFVDGFAGEFAEPVDVYAIFVEWCDGTKSVLLAELEVLCTGAWGDVHDAGSLVVAHFLPFDDAVPILGVRLRGQFVERAGVSPTDHVRPWQTLQHFVFAIKDVQAVFGEP